MALARLGYCRFSFLGPIFQMHVALKHTIDRSRIPVISEDDLKEDFVRGSGPGGQAVNKTNNCVVLTHKPTGIVVKCHQSRLQSDNRKEARRLLVNKLDVIINGENSVEAQKKRILEKKSRNRKYKQRKNLEAKAKLKEIEEVTNKSQETTSENV